MFDIAWSEMALITVVALVVIGPKDLPRAMRASAHWVRKARLLAGEFRSSLDDMVREAELDEVKRDIDKLGNAETIVEFRKSIEDTVDPTGEIKTAFEAPPAEEAAPSPVQPPAAEPPPPAAPQDPKP